jgi:hypothetical protein
MAGIIILLTNKAYKISRIRCEMMKKIILVGLLTIGTIFMMSAGTLASIGLELGAGDFKVDGTTPAGQLVIPQEYSLSKNFNSFACTADYSFLMVDVGAYLCFANMDPYFYTQMGLQIGGHFDVSEQVKVNVFEGIRAVNFTDKSTDNYLLHSFEGLVLGLGVEWRAPDSPLTVAFSATVPETGKYFFKDKLISDNGVRLNNFKVETDYTPLHFTDFYFNYNYSNASSDNIDISSGQFTAGVKLKF